MCFSAQASFAASGLLLLIGLYALKRAQKKNRALAALPLFFSIQQALEGIVWITYNNPNQLSLCNFATYGFCFFAFFFWPTWLPFAILQQERILKRRKILYVLLALGVGITFVLILSVMKNGIGLAVACHHIKYDISYSSYQNWIGAALYCLATIMPFFVTSTKKFAWLGALMFSSALLTHFVYENFFVSVWCFFAALLSSIIAWIV